MAKEREKLTGFVNTDLNFSFCEKMELTSRANITV
jgi:hypothetical protein